MRKTSAFLFLVFCFYPFRAFASPSGNPSDPSHPPRIYPVKIEGIADIVFRREFDISPGKPRLKGQWYLSKMSVNLNERADIYGILGTADIKVVSWPPHDFTVESDRNLAWGGGFKYLVFETAEYGEGLLKLSFDANYRDYDPTVETVKKQGADLSDVTERKLRYRQWEASLGVSYQVYELIPYAGVKYSDSDIKISFKEGGTVYSRSANSKDTVGFFLGADYVIEDNLFLNLECRLLDETAVNAGLKIIF